MNMGTVLRQLGEGYARYEQGRDQGVWRAFEEALARQHKAELDFEDALGEPPRPSLTHDQAFQAGMTAAIAALLGAKPEALYRAVGGYVQGVQAQQEEGDGRRLQQLSRHAASARRYSDTELARAKVSAEALESARRRTAALVMERSRSQDENLRAERDREARLQGIRIQSASKEKSDQVRASANAEAQRQRASEAQIRELGDLFLGLLSAQSKARDFGGLSIEAQQLLDQLYKRLGISSEVRPLRVVPISGPIRRSSR